MSQVPVEIMKVEYIALDVIRIQTKRPRGFHFEAGQGTMVAIDKEGWRDQERPFTFTGLSTARSLEFIIKIYREHDGVTKQMALLRKGERLLLNGVFGTIQYKGPGVFFAGGVGITPFVAIFRDLHKRKELKGNMLVFSTRTAGDVILDDELTRMLGKRYLNIFTRQSVIGFRERRIDRDVLITLVQDFDKHFYICGPQRFVNDLERMLVELGVTPDLLVVEQ